LLFKPQAGEDVKKIYLLFVIACTFFLSCSLDLDFLGTLWSPSDEYRITDYPQFKVGPGVDFRILQFTDTHINTYYDDFETLQKTYRMMTLAIHENSPDLLILTGDNVANFVNSVWAWQLISFLDSFRIPYALIMGNHDGDFTLLQDDNMRHVVADIYSQGKYSLFTKGPDNIGGVGNFGIQITNEKNQVIYSLVLMDSNRDYIRQNQVHWYEWYIKGLNKAVYGDHNPSSGKTVKNLTFVHIPLPEINDVRQAMVASDPAAAAAAFGGSSSGQTVNTGLFQRMKDLKSTTHIFFGHDHLNTLDYAYQGIHFVYGLKTGYNAYHDPNKLGATLITIKNDSTVRVDFKYMR
jgi:3',5'-cyclic AMP phosphodiesterase CpdA